MENTKKHSFEFIVAALTLAFALSIGLSMATYHNRCVSLEAGIRAQRIEARNRYSQMRTEIVEMAGVNAQYRADIDRAFDRAIGARQGNRSEIMRAITEANPTINTATYTRVQRAIEARRNEFHDAQTMLTDRGREYTAYVHSIPGAWWNTLLHFPHMNIDQETAIVTTEETAAAFRTGGHDTPLPLPTN